MSRENLAKKNRFKELLESLEMKPDEIEKALSEFEEGASDDLSEKDLVDIFETYQGIAFENSHEL